MYKGFFDEKNDLVHCAVNVFKMGGTLLVDRCLQDHSTSSSQLGDNI